MRTGLRLAEELTGVQSHKEAVGDRAVAGWLIFPTSGVSKVSCFIKHQLFCSYAAQPHNKSALHLFTTQSPTNSKGHPDSHGTPLSVMRCTFETKEEL